MASLSGHASASKIQPLISRGLLGFTKFESFNCLNCQLRRNLCSSAWINISSQSIAIATIGKWKLFQMDVKNAFLHGDSSEKVYMHPPPSNRSPHKACKALYGLKQAPQAWVAKFNSTLTGFGFMSSPHHSANKSWYCYFGTLC